MSGRQPAVRNSALAIALLVLLVGAACTGLELAEPELSARELYDRAVQKLGRGNARGAIEDYSQAIKAEPGYLDAYLGRARARSALGDQKRAVDDYTEALRLSPNTPAIYVNRGNARFALGDFAGAIEDYDVALALNPDEAGVYMMRAQARAGQDNQLGAIEDFCRAAAIWSDAGDAVRAAQAIESAATVGR